MADLIPNPAIQTTPQSNTDYRNRPGQVVPQTGDGKITTLSDLTQIIGNHNLSEELGEQNLSDSVLMPKQNAFTPKDPAVTAKLLQALLSKDMFISLGAAGSTELVNKLTEFADEVMLSPENLPEDLARQQSKTTMFSGDLWKLLKGIFEGKISPDATGANINKLFEDAKQAGYKAHADTVNNADAAKTDNTAAKTDNAASKADNSTAKTTANGNNPEVSTGSKSSAPAKAATSTYNNISASGREAAYNAKLAARSADSMKPHFVTVDQMKQVILSREAAEAFPKNEIYKNAAFDFLKAAVNVSSKEDILNSVAANLKYLAAESAPSMAVRNELTSVADNLTLQNFPMLKGRILELLNTTGTSLLLNNNTKALIPLAVYNMSRLSFDVNDLTESFSELLKLSSDDTSGKLKLAFIKYIEESDLSSEDKVKVLEGSEIASAKHSMTLIAERLSDSTAQVISVTPSDQIADTLTRILDLHRGKADAPAYDEFGEPLPQAAKNAAQTADSSPVGTAQIPLAKTVETVKQMVAEFTPDKMKGALNTIIRDFEKTKNLNEFAGRLSMIVNKITEPDKKMVLAQALNDVLGSMAADKDVNYTPPTATETLADFLAKNLNDPALKTLSELNPGEMVRSLLAAPGSNTPLVHMMAPLELGGLRAFGEIWVDPAAEWIDSDGKGKKGEKEVDNRPVSHVFLAFDVENTGYFEMELYSREKDLNISIMCPRGMEQRFSRLADIIPKLCETQGFVTKNMVLASIHKPRELTEVFPKLTHEITGLNVKC
ncbi:MAG: hypothetical protein LBL98_04350 [Ruminococcus sp.]|jgi:hypothetical protein|nr:hypothetical protein [Ruminococcus sp.]